MSKIKEENTLIDVSASFPVLPLRDVVVYRHMVIPLFVGRERSINSLDKAMADNKQIVLVSQKNADIDEPNTKDLHRIGTVANILQLLKLPDGTVKVLVEGVKRAKIKRFNRSVKYISANIDLIEDHHQLSDSESDTLIRTATNLFDSYVKLNKKIPPEVLTSLMNINDISRLTDTIAAHMTLKVDEKQQILEMENVEERLEHLMVLMEGENDVLHMEKKIRVRVKKQMEKNQREYYLNEQMKAIQKELGESTDTPNESDELENKINAAGMTKEAKGKALNELKKLKMMSPMSAEATVVRNYIDALLDVPWKKRSRTCKELSKAQEILDADHFGLEKVKERILEYLAVQQRMRKMKGPILCLVGPPGVGKTSLGQSIARSTGRKFIRMALGGVRDEAEIRGHRKTYIGAMPGKIIHNMSKVGTKNPLFLLDEIDKMSNDVRGDPSSAMLEVLDPEQNHTFNDHYLEVDYDLSEVMFVATANTLNIPSALLDRMEVIRLSGYTEDEKIDIAEKYLIPKQIENNGLKSTELIIKTEIVRNIIRYYTRESGVRGLEREIAKICRKVVKNLLLDKKLKTITVAKTDCTEYLGVKRFNYGKAEEKDQIGQVTGLAWTEVGGELLQIEAALVPGKGKFSQTGQLGDVMKESIEAAMTVVRSRSEEMGLDDDRYQQHDVHIHMPEGAVPKDGPSAGVGMATCLLSVYTNIAVKADVAMTGEITLRGQVLPIGGLKEKLLAAHRGGIKTVIIPSENEKDLAEIPDNVKQNLEIIPVKWIDDVWKIALTKMPKPAKKSKKAKK